MARRRTERRMPEVSAHAGQKKAGRRKGETLLEVGTGGNSSGKPPAWFMKKPYVLQAEGHGAFTAASARQQRTPVFRRRREESAPKTARASAYPPGENTVDPAAGEFAVPAPALFNAFFPSRAYSEGRESVLFACPSAFSTCGRAHAAKGDGRGAGRDG